MQDAELLSSIPTPEFDYIILNDRVKGFKFPRNKIGHLIKKHLITRVKKGIYVKNNASYDRFVLANMISGPSYVSQDSALSFHGFIPERVESVISTTANRKRSYATPLGSFEYEPISEDLFSIGIERRALDENRFFLIANPEKALFDRLYRVKGLGTQSALYEYLFSNMRLDEQMFYSLKVRVLSLLAQKSKKKFMAPLLEIRNRRE